MSLKTEVLSALEQHKGEYVSGQQLADSLNVSRNAVWKVISMLKKQGYKLDCSTKLGYCLNADNDILSQVGINKYLGNFADKFQVLVYDEVTSTNTLLKNLAEQGAAEGSVVVASMQSQGRGRSDREFFSPSGSGVYFSLLLRPKIYAEKALNLTAIAGVSLVDAIKSITGLKTQIKWVNDVYYLDKKIAGILSEASLNFEDGMLSYVVVGIGVNLYYPQNDFPKSIKDKAGCLITDAKSIPDLKNQIVAETLIKIIEYSAKLPENTFLQKYKDYQWLTGKEVYILKGDEILGEASVIGIDDQCRLILKNKNGEELKLSSGEVSIKKK